MTIPYAVTDVDIHLSIDGGATFPHTIATGEAKPNGEIEIPGGQVKPFLSPLSILPSPSFSSRRKAFPLLASRAFTGKATQQR